MAKRIGNILLIVLMCVLCVGGILLTCLDSVVDGDLEAEYTPVEMEYTTSLFGGDVISINIICDQDDWDSMIDNVEDEVYTMIDIEVNGVLYENCGIRLKGNSSLTTVASTSGTDRYSFRIKFNAFISGQTCCGLDTLILNNAIYDNTYMKEYIAYDLFDYMGVNSVLCTYGNISVNDSNWGLYVAIEGYDNSYLERCYGSSDAGALYKAEMSDTSSYSGCFVYEGDSLYYYSELLSNPVNTVSNEQKSIIVAGIKALNSGDYDEIEQYWDIDSILRYLAVHTTMVNMDSLTGGMTQNFYIYEQDGLITLLPWDYNECLGGAFSTGVDIVNFAIDSPVANIDMEDLPIVDVLLANDEYSDLYHQYLAEICVYLEDIDNTVASIRSLIDEYVEADSTAFVDYSTYIEATDELVLLLSLRCESISGQLDGSIPSTTTEQNKYSYLLVNDYVDIDLVSPSTISSSSSSSSNGMFGNMPSFGGNTTTTIMSTTTTSSSSSSGSTVFYILLSLLAIFIDYKVVDGMEKIK